MAYSANEIRRQYIQEFVGSIFLLVILGCILSGVTFSFLHDNRVLATSRDVEVMVIGKKIGSGKGDPRMVYIKDGVVPVGVKTTARWYFQTTVGQKTVVKYSPVYHEYRQPYHRTNPEKYFLGFISIMFAIVVAQMIYISRNIWHRKK